jgi:hypothetical protein
MLTFAAAVTFIAPTFIDPTQKSLKTPINTTSTILQ